MVGLQSNLLVLEVLSFMKLSTGLHVIMSLYFGHSKLVVFNKEAMSTTKGDAVPEV
jgi:hypothetical protein